MNTQYARIKELIDRSENILIISHRKPDPDTLGSALALGFWLDSLNKNYSVFCFDKPNDDLLFLPGIEKFTSKVDFDDFDLVITVDIAALHMIGNEIAQDRILNIDHHASNEMFGALNVVEPSAASTTIILYKMFASLDVAIDANMAMCLLAGIYGDTGGFMHSNTCDEVYRIAAHLMEAGAKIADINKALFKTRSVSALKLWGKALEKACFTEDKIVISVLKNDDFDDENNPEELSGVIDYLNMVPASRFAVLINEDRKGNVKGSFRTRESEIDLSEIASKFGGGGHPKASGFILPGKLETGTSYTIVSPDLSKKNLDF